MSQGQKAAIILAIVFALGMVLGYSIDHLRWE